MVFFSTVPAELILFKGYRFIASPRNPIALRRQYRKRPSVDNTDQSSIYVLLSGRWFRCQDTGRTVEICRQRSARRLSKIPFDSAEGSGAGFGARNCQAADAVMLAQIPTTASREQGRSGSKVNAKALRRRSAVQTHREHVDTVCHQHSGQGNQGRRYLLSVFSGRMVYVTTPNGPWKTADSVPKEIYTIPPSSPVYNVTYVTQTNPPHYG